MADKITGISTNDFQLSIAGYGKIASDADDIKQSIFIILFTRPGDDPMRPLFGCDYMDFIDQPVSVGVPNMVNSVHNAIKLYEPRVSILSVKSVAIGSQIFFDLKLTRLSTGETIAFRFPEIALPDITGPNSICALGSYSYFDAKEGGVWTCVNGTGSATIDIITGALTAISAGTITVTYSFGTQSISKAVTINALPVVAGITGPSTVAAGSTITLACVTAGGTWTSDDIAVATVDAVTGVVTGVAGGAVTIMYSVTNVSGCSDSSTKELTISGAPAITIVMWPKLKAIPHSSVSGTPPAVAGYWRTNLVDDGFICPSGIKHVAYPTSPNLFRGSQTQAIWAGGGAWSLMPNQLAGSIYMDDENIVYEKVKGWSDMTIAGDAVVESDAMQGSGLNGANAIQFIGNDVLSDTTGAGSLTAPSVQISPVIVLDATTQTPKGYLLPGLLIEAIAGGGGMSQRVRFTRSHASLTGILRAPYLINLTWAFDATGGFPDPSDAGNANKICQDYSSGLGILHIVGVVAEYIDATTGASYGKGGFSVIFRVT